VQGAASGNSPGVKEQDKRVKKRSGVGL